MKYLLLIALLITTLISYSQFEPINRHSLSYYIDGNQNMACAKIDSITAEGNDSVIWNYNSFPAYYWMTTYCTPFSWLGHKIVKKNSGIYVIYNKNQYSLTFTDSIFIHTKDTIGSTWTLYEKIDFGYLRVEATIENKYIANIFGQTDSVILIRLREYDTSGNIANIYNLNNKVISISKNHGFVNTFKWIDFPGNTAFYNLISIDSISTNYHMLKLYDVYNYEVGDEFHIVDYLNFAPALPSDNYTMMEILSKSYSITNDTVNYLIHFSTWSNSFMGGPTAVIEDTSITTYTGLHKYVSNFEFGHNVFPLQAVKDSLNNYAGFYSQQYDSICSRISEVYVRDLNYTSYNNYYCYNIPEFGTGIPSNTYIEGVGVSTFASENWPDCPNPGSHSLSFVYIKKGNCITGTPLIKPLSVSITSDTKIQVFPNPSNGIFNVNVGDDKISGIEISNYLGEIVKKQKVNTKTVEVDLTEFPKGIYIVKTTGNKTMFGKFVKY